MLYLCVRSLVLGLLVFTSVAGTSKVSFAGEISTAEPFAAAGLKSLQRGDFEQAASEWREAAQRYQTEGKLGEQSLALVYLSQAYQALGHYPEAGKSLELAVAVAKSAGDRAQTALALGSLGNLYIATGTADSAQKYLQEGLSIARDLGNEDLTAAILNNVGNLASAQKKYNEAIAAYRESSSLAERSHNSALAATALTNAATASMLDGRYQEAKALLDKAFEQTRTLNASHDQAYGLINIGLGYHRLRSNLIDSRETLVRQAYEAVSDAGAIAERAGDRRAMSYAWGNLGKIYEDEQRYSEALQLTRSALVAAQSVNAPESLYRWQWQIGRLLKKTGTIDEAIAAYRQAVRTLQSIRPELAVSYGASQTSFREALGPVYFELVDLLLQRAATLKEADQVAPYLVEAREAVELFKVAELRDYFHDDCVDTILAKVTQLDVLAKTTVIVYPILLSDRTELLVSLPTGLKRVLVPVDSDTITQEVRQFRQRLEKRTTRQYLPHAQRLYNWLIRPIEADLASLHIDTLVFVPDGPLRTIPMGALHDGKQFLVAKYALAITPGLNLTDPRPIKRDHIRMLAVGVTEAVQGFPALPNVSEELKALTGLFQGTTLVDKQFLAANLEKELKDEPFTIVHVASHGEFSGDADNAFLLAFDEKVSLERLNQMVGVFKFRDEPLELLTLSACDTAAGDDRAALGLAGMAIKAGARSALATLWNINDEASVDLVVDFYRELKDPLVSRAVALQRAQLKLLANPRYEHPGFWSPFLMINNWL
jgi:CHAT domain-containing protein/outer membrane protein assembly factor BamD (BamD/ComL family)